MFTYPAIPLTCWLCAVVVIPRTPLPGDQAQDLLSARSRGRQPWLTLLARVAPFERALLLLAIAQLHAMERQRDDAVALLAAVRALCSSPTGTPTLVGTDTRDSRQTASFLSASRYPDGLTTREVDVLRLIACGRTNREIAALLFLSVRTVERHITSVYRKTDCRGRADATTYALMHGLLTAPFATTRDKVWDDDGVGVAVVAAPAAAAACRASD